jgi:WD40 repeat protein
VSVAATEASLASPYKGLAPFDDTDADALLFFGRDWETEVVAANVLAARLTVLYGPSGVGKSSLLRAGVVRAVRQSGHPSPAVAVFGTWADDPLAGLEAAARAAVAEVLGRDPTDAPGGLTDRLAAWSAELGAELCLLVDQLEELFLYHPAKDGAAGFVDLLPELVLRPGLRVNVLLGVRDDALAQLDVFKERIPGLFMNSLRLDHLDRRAAREAILGPLARFATIAGAAGAMEIEPELVDEVLDEVAAGRIEPSISGVGAVEGTARAGRIETPYLQLVLQRLWEVERERGSRVLTLETFRSLGGAEQIVQSHLERALRSLSPAEQAAAASVFGHLVTPSGTKIAHGTADLATYAALDEREIRPVLDTLARQRILRPLGENGHVGDRYEIFHDVLAGAVLAWRTRHESDAALEEERRRRRRFGWIAVVALVGLVLMSGLAAYAWSQRVKAREQTTAADQQRALALSRSKKLAVARNKAVRAERRAKRDERDAEKAKAAALVAFAHADTAAANAKHQQALAEVAEEDAKEEEASARNSQHAAQEQRDIANEQKVVALRAKRDALQQKRHALKEQGVAEAAQRRAQFSSYISRSLRELERDPQASMRAAVAASGLAEQDDDQLDAENALRAALVALRVKDILPGVGKDGSRVARFSADGRRAVVAGGPKARSLRVFRVSDGRLLRTFRADAPLTDAAVSADGKFAAGGGADGHVWVVNVDSGAVRTLDHGARVTGVAFSSRGVLASVGIPPDVGTRAGNAFAATQASARLWDASTGDLLQLLPQPFALAAGIFSPDGRRFATYGEGQFVRVYDATTGDPLRTLVHPTNQFPVTSAAFSPSGDQIVTGRGNVARLFNVETGEDIRTFTPHTLTVTDVAFSKDGDLLATASLDTIARLWTVSTGGLFDTHYGHSGLGINDIDTSPIDNTAIVTAGADGTARYSAQGQLAVPLLGHKGPVLHASFGPDGSILTSSRDGTARVWDPYGEPAPRTRFTYAGESVTVAVDSSGTRIAIGRQRGGLEVRSTGGRVISTPISKGPRVVSVAWAKGQTLMAATANGHLRIWRDAGASAPQELDHRGPIRAAAISPDGNFAATASAGSRNGEVRLWTLATGTPRVLPHTGGVSALAFDPKGRFLATGNGEAVYIWPTTVGNSPRKLEPQGDTGNVTGIAFAPGGAVLAASSDDSYIRVWNVGTGQLRNTLVRHGGTVYSVAFSPDGRWLATGGLRKAGVWQIGKSDLDGHFLFFVAPPRPRQGPVTSIAFTRNQTIVMGTDRTSTVPYGAVRAYRCDLCGGLSRLVRIANTKLNRLRDEAHR